MITEENISIVMQIATLLGVVFAVYLYFRKPQEKSEINDEVFRVQFDALEKTVINLRDNHIHTLDEKLSKHISESQDVALRSAETMGNIKAQLEFLINKK